MSRSLHAHHKPHLHWEYPTNSSKNRIGLYTPSTYKYPKGITYKISTNPSSFYELVRQFKKRPTKFLYKVVISFDKRLRDLAKKMGISKEKSGFPQPNRPLKN